MLRGKNHTQEKTLIKEKSECGKNPLLYRKQNASNKNISSRLQAASKELYLAPLHLNTL